MRPEPIHILILLVLLVIAAVIVLGIIMAVVLVRRRARQRDAIPRSSTAGTSSADELTKLANLHHHGALTDEEFAEQKRRLLE